MQIRCLYIRVLLTTSTIEMQSREKIWVKKSRVWVWSASVVWDRAYRFSAASLSLKLCQRRNTHACSDAWNIVLGAAANADKRLHACSQKLQLPFVFQEVWSHVELCCGQRNSTRRDKIWEHVTNSEESSYVPVQIFEELRRPPCLNLHREKEEKCSIFNENDKMK